MRLSSISLALNRPGAVATLEQQVASLFANNEQGAWYDPSAANVTWRRNQFIRTEDFNNAYWSRVRCIINSGASTPPTGVLSADEIECDSAGYAYVNRGAGGAYGLSTGFVLSVYAKKVNVDQLAVDTSGAGSADLAIFDLVAGSVGSVGANVEASPPTPVGNGWYRCSVRRKDSAPASTGIYIGIIGASVGNKVLIAGAQIEQSLTATAYQRIVTPEITYLADVQSQPLLFTDAAGTTPVVGVESPVGLILDRRKGLVLGSELVTNGDFSGGTTGWTLDANGTYSVTGSTVRLTNVTSRALMSQALTTVIGQQYRVDFGDILNGTGQAIFRVTSTNSYGGTLIDSVGVTNSNGYLFFKATTTTTYIWLANNSTTAGQYVDFGPVSVKSDGGNHAYQTTSAARPVLRARYNLLTYSEQFDFTGVGGWSRTNAINMTITANAAVAPDGSTTAEKIRFDAGSPYNLYQNINSATTAGVSYTASVYLRADAPTTISIGFYDNGITRVSTANITTTWTRFTHTATLTKSGPDVRWWFLSQQNGEEFYAWGADLRVGTSAGDYQRIASGTFPADYATTSTITGQPFRPYLHFVADDSLVTASVDFSATDEMTICASLAKQQNSATAVLVELSASANSNNGTFYVSAPEDSTYEYSGISHGNSSININQAALVNSATWAGPDTHLLTYQAEISADTSVMRLNKTQAASGAGDQGGGNYGSFPLYIGRRFTGSLYPLNAYVYGLIIRGKNCTAGELAALEDYMAGKAGLTL